MSEPFELQWGEVRRSIHAVQERLENPKPVLREFLPRGELRQPEWATELMREYWRKPPR